MKVAWFGYASLSRWALALALGLVLLSAGLLVGCDEEEKLESEHPGWAQPNCWSCHDRSRTHNSSQDPYYCVDCHGNNGAPSGHGESEGCGECHGQPHGPDGFPEPEACVRCHGK